jgi:hypothetical protein
VETYLLATTISVSVLTVWMLALDRRQRSRGEPGLTDRDRIVYPGLILLGGLIVLGTGWLAGWDATGAVPSVVSAGLGALNLFRWLRTHRSKRETSNLVGALIFVGGGIVLWFL